MDQENVGAEQPLARELRRLLRIASEAKGVYVLADERVEFAGGAELDLPFQSYDPEFDGTVRSRTLLIVRLTVPGQGVYHASLADVWVRPFSTLRNRIEASTGRRYLPQELRGR